MNARILLSLVLAGLLCVSAGCSRDKGDKRGLHRPRLGGTLVQLGDHAAHMEFVHDAKTGDLTAHIVDAKAATRVRLTQETISLTLISREGDDATGQLVLGAVDDPTLGEKRGDASQFAAASDFLKGRARFDVIVAEVNIGERSFIDVAFSFPEGNENTTVTPAD
jgi:hypothetical protein